MKKNLIIGLYFSILGLSHKSFSQTDTFAIKCIPTTEHKKMSFVISSDMRETFVRSSSITIYGGFVGVRLANKDVYSLGYYTLTNSAKIKFKAEKQNLNQPNLASEDVSLWFVSAGYTHTLYDGKIFKFDIPFELGGGEGSSGIYDSENKLLRLTNNKIFPLQGGVSTIIKFNSWLGVRLQGGYRELVGKSVFQKQYSGWYYTYGISLDFETIFKKLKR
jgi:hypothetical protein